jgi:hypothetical protein
VRRVEPLSASRGGTTPSVLVLDRIAFGLLL